MIKFVKKDNGLVTIEWVGIAAVMVLAGLAITAFVMQGADGAAGRVDAGLDSAPTGTFDGNDDGPNTGGSPAP